jgi:5-methylcytosine-specific restriction protein B
MDQIRKEHILSAIQEIKANPSLRKGRASTTFDLIYEGADYPPKLILSIANRYATGVELDHNSFLGGENKPSFKLLEREGFVLVKKNAVPSRYNLKKAFLQEWPLSRIQSMNLEEYTNLDKTSFCYWLEAKTDDLGSIWGGSSYKFGIYKRRDISTTITVDNRITDGEYAWFQKYGATKEAAFQTIKNTLITIIENAQNNTLDSIEPIDLGDAYKWKIAFLYGDFNVVNIFKHESLLEAAQSLGFKDPNKTYPVLNKYILSQKTPEKDYFEFTDELWNKTSLANPKRYWLYSPGEGANRWEEFYTEGIMALGWDDLGDLAQYASKNEIKEKLQQLEGVNSTKQNDTAANYEFVHLMKPGDVVIAKRGRSEYIGYGIVSSSLEFEDSRAEYKNYRKVDWKKKGVWPSESGDRIVLKTLTDITKYPDYVKKLIKLLGIENELEINNEKEGMKSPLNQILYGPPGTGKTYHTVLEAAKIITGNKNIPYEEALKEFKANLDHQIEFITFHQNYSYEDFIQGLRPDTENGSALTFEKKDGVFKRIADRAYENLISSESKPNEYNRLSAFIASLERLKEKVIDSEQPIHINETAYIVDVEENAFRYTGKNWTLGEKGFTGFRMKYADLIEIFKANVETRQEIKQLNTVSGLAKQHASYFLKAYQLILSDLKENEVTDKIERKNYVIIIDEINRANISRVFGELITLIEEDKRSHGSIPMRVTLPSGDSFIVPSNLHIIGTMNTADKSIALLDIALRRRFEFVPMYPQYEGLGKTVNDADKLRKINEAIVSRKNHDFTIGHAYFMGDDYNLEKTINHKVIPLLLEYFMNTEKEVIDILKEAGITIGGWPLKMIP